MTTEYPPTSEGKAVSTAEAKIEVVSIFIDETEYQVEVGEIAGRDLRQAPEAPIAPDRDLWREAPDGLDELVEDEQIVVIEKDVRFFTVARHITPGC